MLPPNVPSLQRLGPRHLKSQVSRHQLPVPAPLPFTCMNTLQSAHCCSLVLNVLKYPQGKGLVPGWHYWKVAEPLRNMAYLGTWGHLGDTLQGIWGPGFFLAWVFMHSCVCSSRFPPHLPTNIFFSLATWWGNLLYHELSLWYSTLPTGPTKHQWKLVSLWVKTSFL